MKLFKIKYNNPGHSLTCCGRKLNDGDESIVKESELPKDLETLLSIKGLILEEINEEEIKKAINKNEIPTQEKKKDFINRRTIPKEIIKETKYSSEIKYGRVVNSYPREKPKTIGGK